ncbi:MAG: geranylgeranylglyceryl/heptaprenylglyceryl phosphate synthase [Saprospiraceae bacterium]
MTNKLLYSTLKEARKNGEKKFAVLVDPDQLRLEHFDQILLLAASGHVDYFFIGGSLILNNELDHCVRHIKTHTKVPTILFPGNTFQISKNADAILLLSLISGRNPELLIGKHVIAAPYLKKSGLEVMPTGYMLVDGGNPTSVSYISNTQPIPADKEDIAVCTAMAGEMLGMQLIYLDAGSGAKNPVSNKMIKSVSKNVDIPIIVGGGLRNSDQVEEKLRAGADLVVVGNAIEKDPELLVSMAKRVHEFNKLDTGILK